MDSTRSPADALPREASAAREGDCAAEMRRQPRGSQKRFPYLHSSSLEIDHPGSLIAYVPWASVLSLKAGAHPVATTKWFPSLTLRMTGIESHKVLSALATPAASSRKVMSFHLL